MYGFHQLHINLATYVKKFAALSYAVRLAHSPLISYVKSVHRQLWPGATAYLASAL